MEIPSEVILDPATGRRGTMAEFVDRFCTLWEHPQQHLDHFLDFLSPDMTGKTVFEHTLWKALQGEIDVRNCEEFDSFSRFELMPRTGGAR